MTRPAVGLALVAIVLLSGCTNPVVSAKSNVDAGFSAGGERIFVVLDTRKVDEETADVWYEQSEFGMGEADSVCFGRTFLEEATERFAGVGVVCGSYRNTKQELDEDECRRLAARFGADEVVWVEVSFIGWVHHNEAWVLVPYDEIAELTLECTIRKTDKPDEFVWRAAIEVEKKGSHWMRMAETAGRSLVETMLADGVVGNDAVAP